EGHYTTCERSGLCRRQLDHDRSDLLCVVKGHEVNAIRIRRERLVVGVCGSGPVNDLILFTAGLAKHFLTHQIRVDRRHAPDDRLDRAPCNVAFLEFLSGKSFRECVTGENESEREEREFRLHDHETRRMRSARLTVSKISSSGYRTLVQLPPT